jgi:hypothetical protein
VDGEYDLETLGELVMSLKRQHPDTDDASVLLEPHIEYDHLIQVMDVVRSAELPAQMAGDDPGTGAGVAEDGGEDETARPRRIALFTDISIGDAP